MDYIRWRNDIFGHPVGTNPVTAGILPDSDSLSDEETLNHIDRALSDKEIHELFVKEQIGVGLQIIYSNACSNIPLCYVEPGDEPRRLTAIRNLRNLYSNFFQRYCTAPVSSIGNDDGDGNIGFLCYMLWDIFVLYPGNASPKMVATALDVMAYALESKNDNCVVSAIHGLGHWVPDAPRAAQILRDWLRRPTTENQIVRDYARQASCGRIM